MGVREREWREEGERGRGVERSTEALLTTARGEWVAYEPPSLDAPVPAAREGDQAAADVLAALVGLPIVFTTAAVDGAGNPPLVRARSEARAATELDRAAEAASTRAVPRARGEGPRLAGTPTPRGEAPDTLCSSAAAAPRGSTSGCFGTTRGCGLEVGGAGG